MKCPYCYSDVFTLSRDGERAKASTSIVVLHKGGDIEINCSTCKNGVILPIVAAGKELRKGRAYRPVVFSRRGLTTAPKSGQ